MPMSWSVSSMMPSTMVCSGVILVPWALVSMNIVHPVAMATACSSCTNSLNACSSLRSALGGHDAVEHQDGDVVPGDLAAQLGQQAP